MYNGTSPSLDELRDAMVRTLLELAASDKEIAARKAAGTWRNGCSLGSAHQAILQRIAAIRHQVAKAEGKRNAVDPAKFLAQAIHDIAPDTLAKEIFQRARELGQRGSAG